MKRPTPTIKTNESLLDRISQARKLMAIAIVDRLVDKRAETYEPGTLIPCWRHVKECLLKDKE